MHEPCIYTVHEPCICTMEHNLLLKMYDYHCNLFIDGKISLQMFQEIENEYLKRVKLFIINLN